MPDFHLFPVLCRPHRGTTVSNPLLFNLVHRTARLCAALTLLGSATAQAQTNGVTAESIKIGMSAALSGPSAGLGTEYYRGAKAYLDEINAQGGVNGRRVDLVVLDDAYQPDRAVQNTIKLVEQDKVFALFNYVGTPTLTAALPIVKSFDGQALVMLGNLTGAQIQRSAPYSSSVFNVRASYRQEIEAQVDRLWRVGLRKVGIFYQLDAYGRSGTDATRRALAQRGGQIAAEATYRRGATFDADMSAAVKHLRDAGVDVVICTGAYQGVGAFVRTARDAGWNVPVTNVSFVGADNLLKLLRDASAKNKNGAAYTRWLLNSQVVPSYADTSLPSVQQYRQLMDKWKPDLPQALRDANYTPTPYNFVGLEGFLNSKVLVQGLRAAGANLDRARFARALESLHGFDLGIGAGLSFSAEDHQGLSQVYFTTVENGRWVPLKDWAAALRQ